MTVTRIRNVDDLEKLMERFRPKQLPKKGRIKIGEIGVDSGQLMIVDPCYLEQWPKRKPHTKRMFKRSYRDQVTNTLWTEGEHFHRFDQHVPVFAEPGALSTPNDLIASGRWVEELQEERLRAKGRFDYEGACETTLQDHCGVLGDGLAAVFSSGYGDGVYPVFAITNEEGRIVKVEIDMGLEDEDEEES